jgi:hypothetical protein
VFSFFSQSFFIFYEFMMMPMIIFGRYYSIYVILHLATANYCQWPWVRSNGPTDPLHISCICSIWKILHFYSSFSLNPSKSAFLHALTLSLLLKSFFIFYEFMMMPMIIFCRYYSIYVILHLATANYCQWIA